MLPKFRLVIVLVSLFVLAAPFSDSSIAQEASQEVIDSFLGTWEGPWINHIGNNISVISNLVIKPDKTCAYTYRWHPARKSTKPDKPVDPNPKRAYNVQTILTDEGKRVWELSFVLRQEGNPKGPKTLMFRHQESGCRKDDGTGKGMDVPGPCLHGRDSQSGNTHGYLFPVK